MTRLPLLAAIGGAVFLVACEPAPRANIATNTGDMREQMMREQQLRAAQTNNPGMQNAVGVTRDVDGIVRDPSTGGRGNVTAGAPVSVSPGVGGIERGPGVGAPSTQAPIRRR